MADRPFEYVFYALKKRIELSSIINDNIMFTLADPNFYFRKLFDILGDIKKKYK